MMRLADKDGNGTIDAEEFIDPDDMEELLTTLGEEKFPVTFEIQLPKLMKQDI